MSLPQSADKPDAITTFLASNGAVNFSKILYNVPRLFSALNDPGLSMIFAPNDAALQRLSDKTGKSLADLQRDAYGIDILANHLSVFPTKRSWPMFTSINNRSYGSSETDIKALGVTATALIDKTAVLVISSVIFHEDQLVKASLRRDIGALKALGQNDMLMVLIQRGDLKGKDLIALCVSDPEINKLCDAKVDFKQLLRRDYNAIAPTGVVPRDYYVILSRGYRPFSDVQLIPSDKDDDLARHKILGMLRPIRTKHGMVQIVS